MKFWSLPVSHAWKHVALRYITAGGRSKATHINLLGEQRPSARQSRFIGFPERRALVHLKVPLQNGALAFSSE